MCMCVSGGGGGGLAPSSNVESVFYYEVHIYFKNTTQVSGLYLSNGLQTDSPNNLITNAWANDGQQLVFKMCEIKNLYIHAGTWKRRSNDQIDKPIMLNPNIFCLI